MYSSSSSYSTSSSSSSSSASSYFPSADSNQDIPQRIKTPETADKFLDEPQRKLMEESVSKCGKVVCQILTQNKENRGTGFLIGPCLLITNHHILPNKKSAKESSACFFKVVSRSESPYQEKCLVETIKISLDPDRFFFTSPNRSETKLLNGKEVKEFLPASEEHLDFTVVALNPAPYLSTICNCVKSLFDTIPPTVNTPVCVIQCPEVMKSDDILQGDLKWSYGQIKKTKACSITYNAPVAKGSSGGVAIDAQGNLMALHHQTKRRKIIPAKKLIPIDEKTFEAIDLNDPSNVSYEYKYVGVSIQKIADTLKALKEAIEEINRTPLPPDLSSRNVIGLPRTTDLFIGREKELTFLQQACAEKEKWIAVAGMGGIGKTTLVTEYANGYKNDYSLTYFTLSREISQIETGLLDLANVLKITEDSIEKRLKALKTYLETHQERILLIFDSVDDEKTLGYLEAQIPLKGCATVLISSRLEKSISGTNYIQLLLADFQPVDAVKFLIKGINDKDTDQNEASILAEKLSYFPLALAHAAAYIKYTPGCTFKTYRELLIQFGLELFKPDFNYSKNDHTILTTWQRSIEAIKEIHHNSLAEQVLQFASLLGDAPIPFEVLKMPFFNQELYYSQAITKLENYTLIKSSEKDIVLHSLLRKVIFYNMEKDLKEQFLHKAVNGLYDCLKKLDLTLPIEKWRLNSFVPHLAAVLDEVDKHNMPVDKQKMELLSKISAVMHTTDNYIVGITLRNLNRYEEALSHHQYALQIRQNQLGENHLTTADSYHQVGVTLAYLRRTKEAVTALQNMLEIHKKILGDDHLTTANSYREVGVALGRIHRSEEALTNLQKALEIRERLLGDNDLITADSYHQVGHALNRLYKYDEAFILLRKALEIRERLLGDNDLITAESYDVISITLDLLGKYDEATPFRLRAEQIRFSSNPR